jgi:hypothetical protein
MLGKRRAAIQVRDCWGYDRLCTEIPARARYLTRHAMLSTWHRLSSLSLYTGHGALLLCVLATPLFKR